MNQDMERFMNLRVSPQRLTAEETADRLRMSPHEIPILVSRGMLKPLGHPAPNAPKHFLTSEIDDLARDAKWHHKAADAIQEHWRYKNGRKLGRTETQSSSRMTTQEV